MIRFRHLVLTGTALFAVAGTAHAQNTVAGTIISNQAQATYTVNGSAQTTNSTTATFVVDRKVNFTLVTDQAANTQVNIGQTNAVTTYRLTNTTNGTQDFLLDPDQSGLSAGVLPGTDNFDVTNMRAFVDSNGNGVYDAGVDTATFVDELAPDASVTVFIVADIPNQANANLAFVSLHVTAAAGGATGTKGAALVATDLNVLNADNEVDIVFADNDSDGAFPGDTARNGQARVYAAYEVGTHAITLDFVKTSRVVSDGINGLNPRAIPGAVVEYCLTVRNQTLLTAATGLTLTDVVPANTTYVPGSITLGDVGLLGACILNPVAVADSTAYNGSTRTVTAAIGTLAGGLSKSVAFRVTVN